jgi:hypothetical protein
LSSYSRTSQHFMQAEGTVLTRALQRSISWARSIRSIPSHHISLRSILMSSIHLHLGLHSGLFHSGSLTSTLYEYLYIIFRYEWGMRHIYAPSLQGACTSLGTVCYVLTGKLQSVRQSSGRGNRSSPLPPTLQLVTCPIWEVNCPKRL